jgi:hypothetical protein
LKNDLKIGKENEKNEIVEKEYEKFKDSEMIWIFLKKKTLKTLII